MFGHSAFAERPFGSTPEAPATTLSLSYSSATTSAADYVALAETTVAYDGTTASVATYGVFYDVPAAGISYVGGATGVDSATLPTHEAGDFILATVFRDGSTTSPTIPSGWTLVAVNAIASTYTLWQGTYYQFATAPGTSSGTWTGATSVGFTVYRGVSTYIPVISQKVFGSPTSSTASYPAITDTLPAGTWVVGSITHRSTNTSAETPPTGMVNRINVADAVDEIAVHDTNGPVESWSVQTVALGGTAGPWITRTIALLSNEYLVGTTGLLSGTVAVGDVSYESEELIAWTDAGNALVSDDSTANITTSTGAAPYSEWLEVSGFTGLSIPSGATILAIIPVVEARAVALPATIVAMAAAGASGSRVWGQAQRVITLTDTADTVYTLEPNGTETFGGVATTYIYSPGPRVRAWASSDFDSNFAIGIFANNGSPARTIGIDSVQVEVQYLYVPSGDPTASYTSTTVSAGSYTTAATAEISASNVSTSASAYLALYNLYNSYTGASSSVSAYGTDSAAVVPYSGTTVSEQNYLLSADVALDFINYVSSTSSAQSYTALASAFKSYFGSTLSGQNYALLFEAFKSYFGLSTSAQGYTSQASAFKPYVGTTTSAQGYTQRAETLANYIALTAAGVQTYSADFNALKSYNASTSSLMAYFVDSGVELTATNYTTSTASASAYTALYQAVMGYSGSTAGGGGYVGKYDAFKVYNNPTSSVFTYTVGGATTVGYAGASAGASSYLIQANALKAYGSANTSSQGYATSATAQGSYASATSSLQQYVTIAEAIGAYLSETYSVTDYRVLAGGDLTGDTMKVVVAWDEWLTVGDVQKLTARVQTLTVSLRNYFGTQVVEGGSATVVVSEPEGATVQIIESDSAVVVVPNNAL